MLYTIYQDSYNEILRRDAKKTSKRQGNKVWVEDRRVKAGGYWRALPNGGRQAPAPPQNGGYLKAAALLFGGAAMGGAIGVLATKWADQSKVKKAVATAREAAEQQAQQEVSKIKQELETTKAEAKSTSGKYEGSLKTIAQKEREINELQTKHQKEKEQITGNHDKAVQSLTDKHAKELADLRAAAAKKESAITGEVKRLNGELTKLQESHGKEVDRLRTEHEYELVSLQLQHTQLQAEHNKLQSENATRSKEFQKTSEGLKAKTKELDDLKKNHEVAIKKLTDKHTATVAELQQEIGRKEGEVQTSAKASTKALSDKDEAHKSAIDKLQKKHGHDLKALEDKFNAEKEEAISRGTQERKSQLEQEYYNKAEENKSRMERELSRRTELATADANTKAMEQLTRDRERVMNEARLKILEATEPKARQPGQLIDDDKTGIVLGASIRQGYSPSKDPKNVARNFNDAIKRMVARKEAEALQDLGVEFKSHAESVYKSDPYTTISNLKPAQIKTKWQKMETAFLNQGFRETTLTNNMDEIRKTTLNKYQRAWADLSSKAQGRGGYQNDLVDEFDKRAARIHNEMLQDIARAIEQVKQEHPLDVPFTGGKSRGDSDIRTYAVIGG